MNKIERVAEDIFQDFYECINDLKNKQAFKKYINECIEKAKGDIGREFLGFMDDYMNLARIIPKHLIIVDVGCAYGFQHIIFKDFKGYIGIDISCMPKAFTKNARFIKGNFRDVVRNKLKITDEMFGIDNMSLLYSPNNDIDIRWFNKLFKKKFNR